MREGRLVVAPVRRSVKSFLHPARCNAFNCMSAFWSMIDMRAQPYFMPANLALQTCNIEVPDLWAFAGTGE